MAASPYPVDPVRTGISLAYVNEDMIADEVLPVATPVAKTEFTYNRYPIAQGLTVPDTRMGRRSEANTIEVNAEKVPASTEDFALSDLVPNKDIDEAADSDYDPLNHATETVTDLLILDREVRTSGLVFNAASYDVGRKIQLAGGDQMHNDDVDVFNLLWQYSRKTLKKSNIGVFGAGVWNQLAIHPKLLASVYGSASTTGVVLVEDLARRLNLKKILIGEAQVNIAKPNQPEVLAPAWGNHIAFLHVNQLANNQRGMTFGMTVPRGKRYATRIIDEPKIGLGGSQRPQVETSVKELICASSCGAFIQDAVGAV